MVAAVILAAGGSRRLGRSKQLVEIDGQPLLRRIALRVLASSADSVSVVVGASDEPIRAALSGLPIDLISNPNWSEGMASSIRSGVKWARRQNATNLLIALSDQVRLTTAHLDAIVTASRAHSLVASRYAGRLGAPASFGSSFFDRLVSLTGDQGARVLIEGRCDEVRAIDWEEGCFDLDTPSDLQALRERH